MKQQKEHRKHITQTQAHTILTAIFQVNWGLPGAPLILNIHWFLTWASLRSSENLWYPLSQESHLSTVTNLSYITWTDQCQLSFNMSKTTLFCTSSADWFHPQKFSKLCILHIQLPRLKTHITQILNLPWTLPNLVSPLNIVAYT